MAWDDEMVAIVRGLIQDYIDPDTGDPPTYTDDRLSTIILIAGQNVQSRVATANKYKINVADVTMTPDPTNTATRDESFINLASLKAACILVNAEVRQFTAQGISVRDGSSAVSLSRSPASLALMQKTYCSEFENALYLFQIGGVQGGAVGEAIVGPVKAWYFGGGRGGESEYGTYGGPGRVGRVGSGSSWYGYGNFGGGPNRESGGNWGNG
jgi:hypothetical protein